MKKIISLISFYLLLMAFPFNGDCQTTRTISYTYDSAGNRVARVTNEPVVAIAEPEGREQPMEIQTLLEMTSDRQYAQNLSLHKRDSSQVEEPGGTGGVCERDKYLAFKIFLLTLRDSRERSD
ncbi:MAG: hypothetical protein J5835_05655 [Bacteroidales bacterium]|nr:hypothetical protein [Bacteroidales bacterium]